MSPHPSSTCHASLLKLWSLPMQFYVFEWRRVNACAHLQVPLHL